MQRLVPSRLHELHESKLSFVSRIEFFHSKLSIFLLMYPGSLSTPRVVIRSRCHTTDMDGGRGREGGRRVRWASTVESVPIADVLR